MLTTGRLRRALAWPVLMLLIAAAATITTMSSAQAEPALCAIYNDRGELIGYEECEGGIGGDNDGGNDDDDGSGGGPSCDLTPAPPSWGEPPYTFCEGTTACTYEELPSGWEDAPGHEDIGPQPSPEHILVTKWCRDAGAANPYSETMWIDGSSPNLGPPSLAEQARRAYGSLAVPDFSVKFGPADRSYVGRATHLWIEGPDAGQIIGTPTFTLVAVGEPSHLEINPGNGDPTFTCRWVLEETPLCAKTYSEPTPGSETLRNPQDDVPNEVTVTVVYDVHFEPIGGGDPLDIANLDPALLTIENSESIPMLVNELQAIITQ